MRCSVISPNQDPYPVEIVADSGDVSTHRDLSKLEAVLAGDPRFGSGTIQASAAGNVLALTVPIRGDVVSSADVAAVRQLRSDVIPSIFNGSQAHVYVGGQTAETADYFSAVSAPTPYVLLFVLGLSFILLLLAFRSLVVALVSILLNLLSVGAAYGLLTLVFIHGVERRLLRLPEGDRNRRLGAAVLVFGSLRPFDRLPGIPDEPDKGTL